MLARFVDYHFVFKFAGRQDILAVILYAVLSRRKDYLAGAVKELRLTLSRLAVKQF